MKTEIAKAVNEAGSEVVEDFNEQVAEVREGAEQNGRTIVALASELADVHERNEENRAGVVAILDELATLRAYVGATKGEALVTKGLDQNEALTAAFWASLPK